MEQWFSNFLVDARGGIYESYQFLRPDYCKAMRILPKKARKLLRDKGTKVAVLDVACGDAIATRQVFNGFISCNDQKFQFFGLDHDLNLLNAARRRWPQIKTHHGDMVRSNIQDQFDLILCSFAYHHVPDLEKRLLCKNLLKWCKPDGDLLVLEICLSKAQIPVYYTEVKRTLPRSALKEQCARFLDWTMSNNAVSNGEWKVDMRRLKADFKQTGWILYEAKTIWTAPLLPRETGCYFFHFRPGLNR